MRISDPPSSDRAGLWRGKIAELGNLIGMKKPSLNISRRRFLKVLAGASVGATLGSAGVVSAQKLRYGKLVDSFRCIGCKRCMSACKRWNNLRVERDELITDWDTHLTANNYTVVNLRTDAKNRSKRHYVYFAPKPIDYRFKIIYYTFYILQF